MWNGFQRWGRGMDIRKETRRAVAQWTGVLIWPVLALLLIAAVWAGSLRRSEAERELAQQNALNGVLSTAHAYEQYITRSVAQMDQVSMQLRQSWEQSGGQLDLGVLARDGMFHDGAFGCVAISDGAGNLGSVVRAQGCNRLVQLAAVVAHHKGNNSSALRISAPDAGASQQFIMFSRRLDTPDNEFAGVVLMLVRADYFTSFYMPSMMDQGGSVAIMGTDSTWRAEQRSPSPQNAAAAVFPRPGGMWQVASGSTLVQGRGGFTDGKARLLGWSQSTVYPIAGLVAVPLAAIMAPLDAAGKKTRSDNVIITFALLLFAVLATLLSRRAADRYSAQENVRKAYRTATDGASDGFYMAAPVRDRQCVIRDFEIVDCNERGARFYGIGRQSLIGKRLSQLQKGPAGEALITVYRMAMEQGFHEDERQMPDSAPGTMTWGHRRIVRVGTGLAITLRDITERKSHMAELDRLSNEDALTGLPNRQWLMTFLPGVLAKAAGEVALLFVDLNDFKHVNDTHGHQVGDQLLKASVQRLKSLLRPEDVVVRFGGDEFVVLLTPTEGDVHSARVAARIVEAFAAPFALDTVCAMIGAGVGISVYPRDGAEANQLIRHADIAKDAGKAEGKGQYRFYDASLSRSLQGRLQLKQSLLDAIELDQFVLHYQPRVNARTGELCSMEALVRWMHPEHGLISPLDFIPLAESSGLILRIGEMVMDKACAQMHAWRSAGLSLVPVSINVSPKQFAHGEVPGQLALCLQRHAIAAELLEVEITESAMMGEQHDIIAQLDAIRALGVKLHVDDFGTGYSSLSQLQKLRMDVLKVDRAFTAELGQSKEGKVFFQAIVSMAHALGMTVVAEGVETAQQLEILQELACNEVQGFYVARPAPADAMAALMTRRFLYRAEPVVQFISPLSLVRSS